MPPSRTLFALTMALIAMSPGCDGCLPPKEKSPQLEVPDGSVSALMAQQALQSPEFQGSLLIGEEDNTNRYPFTVSVVALSPSGEPRYRGCAGVLLTPQLVLTAGQCVCRPQKESQPGVEARTRIDTSDCAATATVVTYSYEPLTHQKGVESWVVKYEGAVRPHPRLELLMDDQGTLLVANADLAVVRLDTAVQRNIAPIRLAEDEAKIGELLTVVGYGYIEPLEAMNGTRRFTQERVLKFLEPNEKRALFGSPELHAYKGDTGGPCLRESKHGHELLGISSRGLGTEPTFTSTYPYRDWLDEEIRLAETERSKKPLAPEHQRGPTQ